MNPDRLAELEEERDFLLRSITDLDRELAAGDVTTEDHRTLRDDYTARAAAVLKSIEAGRAALPARRRRDPRRLGAAIGATLVAIVAVVWLLTSAAEDDSPASEVAASPCPSTETDPNVLIVEARSVLGSDPSCAIELFRAVLEQEPDNVEARTYTGWTIALYSTQAATTEEEFADYGRQALLLIDAVREQDPSYVDAQCFAAIIRFNWLGDAAAAAGPLAACQEGDLPASVAPLVGQLAERIDAALASTTVAPATSTP